MSTTELDPHLVAWEIRQAFPAGATGSALAECARSAWNGGDGDWAGFRDRLRLASSYATHAYASNAYSRQGDLAEWFSLAALPFEELARRGLELHASWWATQPDPEDEERLDRERWAADEADERIARIEEQGGYGRTLRHTPESDQYLFVRLGGLPRAGGYSLFGLAGADTEEGPDPWRTATGGKTRESGTSVFRAYRHPDVPDALVLIAPDFTNAIYSVPSEHDYFLSVIPGRDFRVLRIDGSPVVSAARHGAARIELGTDGEYLLDPRRQWSIHELPRETIWISESVRLDDFVERYVPDREHPEDADEALAMPSPRA